MKYTQSTLDKLEAIPEQAGYVLRYERGTFQSGYCILEERKVVVLNKFLQTEGRINTQTNTRADGDHTIRFLEELHRRARAVRARQNAVIT